MDGQPPTNNDRLDGAAKTVECCALQERRKTPWIALDDLMQAGWEGYMKGLHTYDAKHGVAKSTWTEIKVRSAMADFARQERRARTIDRALYVAKNAVVTDEVVGKTARKTARMLSALGAFTSYVAVAEDKSTDPEALCSDEDALQKLRAHLDVLPPQERKVIELVREGLSNNEIAAALHVDKSTVSHQKETALRRLRRAMHPPDQEA